MVPLTGLPPELQTFFQPGHSVMVEAPNLPDVVNRITAGWANMDADDKPEMLRRLEAQPEPLLRLLDLDRACLLVLLDAPPF